MKEVERAADLNPDTEYLHVGVWAQSGAGKTFLQNQCHMDDNRPSILIAQPKDEDDYELYGESVSTKTDLYRKLKAGKKIHFNPPTNGKEFLKEINLIYKVCKKYSGEVLVYVDEVHRVALVNAPDDLMAFGDIMTDARGHGVRFMIASQSLNRFSNKTGRVVVGACQLHILLQIDPMAKGFYRYYNMPYEKAEELINNVDYAGVMYANGEGVSEPFKLY